MQLNRSELDRIYAETLTTQTLLRTNGETNHPTNQPTERLTGLGAGGQNMRCLCISATAKRNLLYINVALFKLFVSMEYAIIMPSLWQYLSNEYNSSKVYFGLCVAGFHIGGLPSSLLMGLLNDWKFSVKSLVLFGNVIQVSYAR